MGDALLSLCPWPRVGLRRRRPRERADALPAGAGQQGRSGLLLGQGNASTPAPGRHARPGSSRLRPRDERVIAIDDVAVVLPGGEFCRPVAFEIGLLELAIASGGRDAVMIASLGGWALLPAGVAVGMLPGIEAWNRG